MEYLVVIVITLMVLPIEILSLGLEGLSLSFLLFSFFTLFGNLFLTLVTCLFLFLLIEETS